MTKTLVYRRQKTLAFFVAASLIAAYFIYPAAAARLRGSASPEDLNAMLTAYAQGNANDTLEMFLKIEGIEGESQDAVHRGEIAIESFDFASTRDNERADDKGKDRGAGKVNMQDFHFTMHVNKASPKLWLASATGEHLKSATLSVRKKGGSQDFLKWTLQNVMVSSYETSGSGSDIMPMDQISLHFSKVEVEYKEQKADGTLGGAVKAGWDVQRNKKL